MLMSWKRMTLVPASLVLLAAPALAQDVAQDVAQDLVTADDVEAIAEGLAEVERGDVEPIDKVMADMGISP
jgi:predicted transcriptional regulator